MSTPADLRQVVIHLRPEPRISADSRRLLKPHGHFRRDRAASGNEIVKLLSRDAEAFAAALIDMPSSSRLSPINSPGWGGLFISVEFASFSGPGPIYLNDIIYRPSRRLFWIRAGAIDLLVNGSVFRRISKRRSEPSMACRSFEACVVPQPSSDNDRIKLHRFPPCRFVAAAMEDTMVDTTKRNRELVADPPAQRPRLRALVGKLLAENAEFQHLRPDMPQGDLRGLSEKELEILVTEFERDRATEAGDTDPTPPGLCSIKVRPESAADCSAAPLSDF
jgi:hypothetical protein